MATVGPAELRIVVRKLDEAIRVRQRFYDQASPEELRKNGRRPGLSAKAARNVWDECTAGFREASTSKVESPCVRDDDPTRGVQPPTTTEERDQAALYPSELVALLSAPSETVPLYRRALYAVAAYTGLRVGELRGLTPVDRRGARHHRRPAPAQGGEGEDGARADEDARWAAPGPH
jgi:integrase